MWGLIVNRSRDISRQVGRSARSTPQAEEPAGPSNARGHLHRRTLARLLRATRSVGHTHARPSR